MSRSKSTKTTGGVLTVYRKVTDDQAVAEFLKRAAKPADGANDHLARFAAVADSFLKSGIRSFNFQDFLTQAKRYGLEDAAATQALFNQWVTVLETCCRVERCENTCYDTDLFILLN